MSIRIRIALRNSKLWLRALLIAFPVAFTLFVGLSRHVFSPKKKMSSVAEVSEVLQFLKPESDRIGIRSIRRVDVPFILNFTVVNLSSSNPQPRTARM